MKRGISLVALIITIIVLVILTGAVVINAINIPSNANLTVFKTNVGAVQDAVTIKMLNNLTENAGNFDENAKWIGVVQGYTIDDIASAPIFDKQINGVNVAALDENLKNSLSINDEEFAKYYVSENGTIYHEGFIYDGVTYYNSTFNVTIEEIIIQMQPTKLVYEVGEEVDTTGMKVVVKYSNDSTMDITDKCVFSPILTKATGMVGNTEIAAVYGGKTSSNKINISVVLPEWINSSTSLNEKLPYVSEIKDGRTYYAPIPKGFSVVEGTKISTGLVIQDAQPNKYNQFVWVPVNNTYNITNALNTVVSDKNALEYWKSNVNGIIADQAVVYNEPSPNTEGSWTKIEWDLMYASVIRYGGFYVGRYETGGTITEPVVQSGKEPITNIKWNNAGRDTTLPQEGTATYVSRLMYNEEKGYGAISTLIYGIQWDTIMNWANCANENRELTTYSSSPSLTGEVYFDGISYDVENNIYDIKGNVLEWTMEGFGSNACIFRGGYYGNAYNASKRSNSVLPTFSNETGLGFRIALYVK